MRSILVLLVLLGGLITGGWIGGETLMARSTARAIAADPRISAGGVEELREAQRIGLRITMPRFADPAAEVGAEADWLDLWLRPQAPNAVQAALAPGAGFSLGGRRLVLGPQGGAAMLRFSPTHGLDLSQAGITASGLTLDGVPAVARLALSAALTGYGLDAPKGTGAAYAVTGEVSGIGIGALSAGAMDGTAAAEGGGRVWLAAVPLSAGTLLRGARGAEAPPRLVGFRLDGVRVTLDDLAARIFGRVIVDPAGLAEGEILIDSADAPAILQRAAAAGLIAADALPMANTVLQAIAVPAEGAEAELGAPPRSSVTDGIRTDLLHAGGRLPDLQPGEIRLRLTFQDGRAMLGPLPLGPAPRLAPPGG